MAAAGLSFPVKRVTYSHRENVAVLTQNENGPCPLLALANALLLRGAINIHGDIGTISFEELTSLIAGYMFDQNPLSDAPEMRANQQQNLSDCMALFPKLNRGLDVVRQPASNFQGSLRRHIYLPSPLVCAKRRPRVSPCFMCSRRM